MSGTNKTMGGKSNCGCGLLSAAEVSRGGYFDKYIVNGEDAREDAETAETQLAARQDFGRFRRQGSPPNSNSARRNADRPQGRPGYDKTPIYDGKDRPPSAPPKLAPRKSPSLRAIDPGAMLGAKYRTCYIWLNDGTSFWFFPTFIGRESAAGFRWGRRGWTYSGFDLRKIDSFTVI